MENQEQLNENTLPSLGTAQPSTEEKIATAEKAALAMWKESIQNAIDAMFKKAKAVNMVYVAHGYEDEGKVPDGVLRFVTNKLQITKATASKYFNIGERETFLRSLKIELPWTSCYKIVSKIDADHEKDFKAVFGKLKQTFKHNLDDITGADIDKVIATALGKEPSDELVAFREVMSNKGWKAYNKDGDVAHLSDVVVDDLQGLVASLDPQEMTKGDKVNLELANRFIAATLKPEPKDTEDETEEVSKVSVKVNTPPEGPDVTITKTEPEPSAEQIQEALETQDAEDDLKYEVVFPEKDDFAWYTEAVNQIQLDRMIRDIKRLCRQYGLPSVKVTIEAK